MNWCTVIQCKLSGVALTVSNKVSTSRLLAQRIHLRMLTLEAECATEVIHESDVAGTQMQM
jgi:hypothetical protein